jgi:hypothetical protein
MIKRNGTDGKDRYDNKENVRNEWLQKVSEHIMR